MVQSGGYKSIKKPTIYQTKKDGDKINPKITRKNKTACISKTKKHTTRINKNF